MTASRVRAAEAGPGSDPARHLRERSARAPRSYSDARLRQWYRRPPAEPAERPAAEYIPARQDVAGPDPAAAERLDAGQLHHYTAEASLLLPPHLQQ